MSRAVRGARGGAFAAALLIVLSACVGGAPTPSPSRASASPSVVHSEAPSASPSSRPEGRIGRLPGPESFTVANAAVRAAQPKAVAQTRRLNLVAEYCVDRDLPAEATSDVTLTVLDRTHMLPRAYAPADLVRASSAGFGGTSGGKLVSARIVDDLAALRRDAVAAGLTIQLQSTYRSYASQVSTFNYWVSRQGLAAALVRSARPGHSEHQLGTTIDFTSPGWAGRFGNWAAQSREGAWMASNAWRYGFVMSYPAGSQAKTCFTYEPWHYRWIGRDAAAAWHRSGLTLHEYLDSLR